MHSQGSGLKVELGTSPEMNDDWSSFIWPSNNLYLKKGTMSSPKEGYISSKTP